MRRRYRRKARKAPLRRKRTNRKRSGKDKIYTFNFTPQEQYVNSNPLCPYTTVVCPAGSFPIRGAPATAVSTDFWGTGRVAKSGLNGLADIGGAVLFNFADMTNFTAFKQFYDNYRINYVDLKVTYLANTAGVSTLLAPSNLTSWLPTMIVFEDNDDHVPPESEQDLLGRQGRKIWEFGMKNSHSIRLHPKPANFVYNNSSGLTTPNGGFYQGSNKSWQDTSNLGSYNDYYGLKFFICNFPLTTTNSVIGSFKFQWKYNISFKGAYALT